MPTYEYTCSHCQHRLEMRQKITEEPATLCPLCQQSTLKRGIGGGSSIFQFVGDGFYITDYKKDKESCAKSSSTCRCQGEEK